METLRCTLWILLAILFTTPGMARADGPNSKPDRNWVSLREVVTSPINDLFTLD